MPSTVVFGWNSYDQIPHYWLFLLRIVSLSTNNWINGMGAYFVVNWEMSIETN